MKKPRVEDFDPTSKVPELASPLDKMPSIEKHEALPMPALSKPMVPESQSVPSVAQQVFPPSNPPSLSPSARTPVRTPVRRTITRYAFEFFQDQIESLRTFSLEEKTRGEKGSMSQMIREALDSYISKRRRLDI